jgi:hypothetical protein
MGGKPRICKVSATGVNIKEMSSSYSRFCQSVFVGLEFGLETGYARAILGGTPEMSESS